MKNWGSTFLLFFCFHAGSHAQDSRVLTRPALPARDSLERLSLKLAWSARLRTEGLRDGLFSVQLLPGKDYPQIAVQTFAGSVSLLHGENGDVLWRTEVGTPYWPSQALAFNSQSLFTIRKNYLYVLNRQNGKQRLWTLDRTTRLPVYGTALIGNLSASPVADENNLIFPMANRIVSYRLPDYDAAEMAAFELGFDPKKDDSPQPIAPGGPGAWMTIPGNYHFLQPPLLASHRIAITSTNGVFLSGERTFPFSFKALGDVSAPMGQHGSMAYVGSVDYTLYALSIFNAQLQWRFLAGAPILRQPHATDNDIFLTAQGIGMFRLDRETGRKIWQHKTAELFLAANPKYVYVADRHRNLLVLDYVRGTQLATYDTRDWMIPLANEWTDRIYLANHDGQIICLHHRDYPKSHRMKTLEILAPPKKEKKDEPKEKEPDKN